MGTKTVSLKTEAYNRLKAARRYPAESFSEVVLRATWPEDTIAAADFLGAWRNADVRFTADEMDRIEAARHLDAPAVDKWAR